VTGDIGDESIIVIWDAITGTPTKTIFNPHPCGIISVDISSDAMFVAALTGSAHDISQQELVIYAWTQDEGDSSLLRERITSSDLQNSVKFDTSNQSELCTTGGKSVCFWNWEMYNLEGYVSKHPPTVKGSLTCTCHSRAVVTSHTLVYMYLQALYFSHCPDQPSPAPMTDMSFSGRASMPFPPLETKPLR
jgi:WD40 repeat protein